MSDQRNFFQRALFSSFLSKKTDGGKIAYLAVCAAFIVVANTLLEFRMFETQISVTFFVSTVAGVILGGLSGFAACFLGDLLGFFINSWGMTYMFWVGLSTATVALIAGWTFTFFRPKIKGLVFVQSAIVCVLSFIVCTVAISSTGFYFYNRVMGFSTAVMDYVALKFGGEVTYFAYVVYRLFFKLQILVNVLNSVLIFLALPLLKTRLKAVFDDEEEKTKEKNPKNS
ncbi:MAG: ECF transporter S component [Clostridia bacterium]|nr:ECF transporter S component [Clostridia bacterium]